MDYFRLLDEAKTRTLAPGARTIRLALLADFATQLLAPLLTAIAAGRGFKLEIYEAGYDFIDFEILNPASKLYAFEPHFIAILKSSQKLKSRFYAAENRAAFAGETVGHLENLWSVASEHCPATVIQANFVTPSERGFGNYELKIGDSLGSVFAAINHELAVNIRDRKNILLFDVDHLAAEAGRKHWFDDRLWSMAKIPCRLDHMPELAKGLTDIALAASGAFAKCVVLDLDNTLWGGVIGDDGLEGIALGDFDEGESYVAFQHFLRDLARRGIILAVVSKNEHDNAVLPFRKHPNMVLREEDIAVFVANWNNKADNIRLVQSTLNIGFDSMVFLDDNPFERDLVREFLPEIVVPDLPEDPSLYVRTLADLNLFETASFSETDRTRQDHYREQGRRDVAKASFANYDDYLASLDMRIALERFNSFNLPRIAQLIQRSNQFNLTTRRHSEAECEAMMTTPNLYAPFTLSLTDKFGEYGLISVIVLKLLPDEIEIDEYLMSCRVLQRGVEDFAMNAIVQFAARQGIVTGRYLKTAKNGMVRDFYSGFGFDMLSETAEGDRLYRLRVASYTPKPTFLTVTANQL